MHADVASLEEIPEESSDDGSSQRRTPFYDDGLIVNGKMANFSRPRPFSPQSPGLHGPVIPILERASTSTQSRPNVRILQANSRPPPPSASSRYYHESSDTDEAAPPPVIRTHADQHDLQHYIARETGLQGLSHGKPYADSVIGLQDSDTDSITTHGTDVLSDSSDSVAQALSTDRSEIAFDGRMGWSMQRPSERGGERQRWAPQSSSGRPVEEGLMVVDKEADHRYGAHESWFIDSGDEGLFDDVDRLDDYVKALRPPHGQARSELRSGKGDSNKHHHRTGAAASSRQAGEQSSAARPQPEAYYPPADKGSRRQVDPLSRHSSSSTGRSGQSSDSTSSNAHHRRRAKGTPAGGAANLPATSTRGGGGVDRAPSNASSAGTKSSGDSDDWRASDFDVSCLSDAKLAKLRKKGVNPALYLEMKQAQLGNGKRGGLGILTGNSFLA